MLAVNLALWTGLVERLVSKPRENTTIHLRLEHAWALWPTVVHLRGFELEVDTYKYQLRIVVPEGRADISLVALARRSFRTRSIHGRDVTIMLSLKMALEDATPKRLAERPSIADFGPPIRPPQRPEPAPRQRAWTVDLNGVDASVRDVWFNAFHLYGPDAHLVGGLRSTPGHFFDVSPTHLTLADGTLNTASAPAALRSVRGALDLRIVDDEREILARTTLGLRAEAELASLALLQPYLPTTALPLKVRGGTGALDFDVRLDGGYFAPGSAATVRARNVETQIGPLALTYAIDVDAQTTGHAERPPLALASTIRGLVGSFPDTDAAILEAKPIASTIQLEPTDMLRFRIGAIDVDAPEVEAHALGPFAAWSSSIDRLGGSARLGLHTHGPLEDLETKSTLSIQSGRLRVGDVKVGANVKSSLRGSIDAKKRRVRIGSIVASIDHLDLETPNGRSEDTWVRIESGHLRASKSGGMSSRLKGQLEGLRPVIAHMDDKERLIERIPDRDILGELEFDAELKYDAPSISVILHNLERPSLHLAGAVRRVGPRLRYALLFERLGWGIRAERGPEGRSRDIAVAIGHDWLTNAKRWVDAVPTRADPK